MIDDRSKMRDGDMPLLDRIESAMRRVTSGQGQMRVPAEATDPDVVLFDCKREIERLREALTAANAQAEHFEREWYLRGDEVERLRAELAESKQDAARLDYLDARNARKNERNGTRYGWRLSENHNRIALEDHYWPAVPVRAAIDAAMRKEGGE